MAKEGFLSLRTSLSPGDSPQDASAIEPVGTHGSHCPHYPWKAKCVASRRGSLPKINRQGASIVPWRITPKAVEDKSVSAHQVDLRKGITCLNGEQHCYCCITWLHYITLLKTTGCRFHVAGLSTKINLCFWYTTDWYTNEKFCIQLNLVLLQDSSLSPLSTP